MPPLQDQPRETAEGAPGVRTASGAAAGPDAGPAAGSGTGPAAGSGAASGLDATRTTLAELDVLREVLRAAARGPAGDTPGEAGPPDPASGATATRLRTLRAGPRPVTGLDRLQAACRLSDFERSVLLLACGPSLVGAVAGELTAATGAPHLTFGAALALLPEAHWSAAAPTSGLRRCQVLVLEDPSRVLTSRLEVDESVLHRVAGLAVPEPRLEPVSRVVRAPAGLPAAWSAAADRLARAWTAGPVRLTGIRGPDAAGLAATAAGRERRTLHALAGADLPVEPEQLWAFTRVLEREARLGRDAFWLDLSDVPQPTADRLDRMLSDVPRLAVLGGTAPALPVPRPAHAEWAGILAARAGALPERVLTWDDLVLPSAQLAQVRGLGAAVRHRGQVLDDWGFGARVRGLGTSALFTGASGTGKTFAAEILAAELGRDLVQIDLSQVVSKYIGETEKHLARLFDAAEQDGSVLFFDEADALFGKRTAVKDSHDRYANIEVSYLLQRLEAFSGLAVLASNARTALDTAFLRRLTAVVAFPHPDAGARLELWRRAFPAAMPRAELDLAALSRIDATGATIMAAALAAAYLAAAASEAVGTGHVLTALDWELAKSGRPAHGVDRDRR